MTALPEPVSTGLTRLARRWQQLPLDQAVVMSGGLRAAIEEYAELVHPGVPVPRVPPAVMPDQLAVMLYDAHRAARLDVQSACAHLARLLAELAPPPGTPSGPPGPRTQ